MPEDKTEKVPHDAKGGDVNYPLEVVQEEMAAAQPTPKREPQSTPSRPPQTPQNSEKQKQNPEKQK